MTFAGFGEVSSVVSEVQKVPGSADGVLQDATGLALLATHSAAAPMAVACLCGPQDDASGEQPLERKGESVSTSQINGNILKILEISTYMIIYIMTT